MKKPWIGVLDCNNFFVSCERLFRPDLAGKPVVVLSSNDGCVVARSQEIKDMGVPMGVPYFQIKDTLKNKGGIAFSSHFALYRDISRRVISVMREELNLVQQYSIDEAFFQVFEDPDEVALRLKKVVEMKVGIPVSVGIARTKTQAKYANSLAKKGTGVCVLSEADWRVLIPNVRLAEIWGIGGQLELKYKRFGLVTVADLVVADRARVSKLFGVGGVRLQQELSGFIAFPVTQKSEPQQSIMHSRSFRREVSNLQVLADALAYHVRHAAAELRSMGQKAWAISVSLRPSRHGDFVLRGGSKEAVLTAPSNDTIKLLRIAQDLLDDLYEPGVPYKKTGVVFSQLVSTEAKQAVLFSGQEEGRSQALLAVVDALNQKQGKELVLLGSRLHTADWQPRLEAKSPAYTTRWKEIALVKAA